MDNYLHLILDFVKEEMTEKEKGLCESLEKVKFELISIKNEIDEKVSILLVKKRYDLVDKYIKTSENIAVITDKIDNVLLLIDNKNINNKSFYTPNKGRIIEVNNIIPNKSLSKSYTLLDGSFTKNKPEGFVLDETFYETKDWSEMFVKLCSLLYRNDNVKFKKIIKSPDMNGRIRKYFSDSSFGMKTPKQILGTGIYVELNQNSNTLVKIMMQMLKKYNLPIDKVKIYLRK